jgi:hypothetical protein
MEPWFALESIYLPAHGMLQCREENGEVPGLASLSPRKSFEVYPGHWQGEVDSTRCWSEDVCSQEQFASHKSWSGKHQSCWAMPPAI